MIHTFSAFWLRSSVVSVLNCVNAVTASIGGLTIHTNFLWVSSGFVLHFPNSQSPQACTNPLSGQPSWALIKQKKFKTLYYYFNLILFFSQNAVPHLIYLSYAFLYTLSFFCIFMLLFLNIISNNIIIQYQAFILQSMFYMLFCV